MRADRLLDLLSTQRILLILCAATLFLSLSGFECASTEMSSAKNYYKNKDYKKAEEFLKKEVAARPQNGEAWTLLGDVYNDQSRYVEMNAAYAEAERATQPPMSAAAKENAAKRRYNAWVNITNITYKRISNNQYAEALLYADTAEILRPGNPENVFIRATAYEALHDDANTDKSYRRYNELISNDVEDGLKIGLHLGQTIDQTEALLGKSENRTSARDMDTNMGGYAAYPAKGLYVYYTVAKAGNPPTVIGWTFASNAKTPVPDFLKQAPVSIRREGYIRLGNAAYKAAADDKRKYDEALNSFRTLEKLDPDPSLHVGTIIAELYVKSGRVAEARAALDKELAVHPNDHRLNLSYGNILFESKDYEGAAEKFKRALDNVGDDKESKELILFNLGAVYKNIGAVRQDSIKVIVDRTKKPATKDQNESFLSPLRESARYFEQLRAAQLPKIDYTVLTELGNLYDVLGEKSKLKQIITDLENIAAGDRDKQYWRAMSYLYARVGDAKKSADADKMGQ